MRLENGKEFGYNSIDMIFKSDTYIQRKMPHENPDSSELIVPLTSDRGLCGGINSSVVREIKSDVKEGKKENFEIIVIGDKGAAGLQRAFPKQLKYCLNETSAPFNYPTVMAIADLISRNADHHDKIIIYYNEFKSAISQILRKMELMPKKKFLEIMKYGKTYNQTRPDKSTSNPALYDLYLASNLWVAFLNNSASEQSARMSAMENASKNAGEIIEKLNL